eukprot:2732837-Pleurochrysis_carterae.AAC.1
MARQVRERLVKASSFHICMAVLLAACDILYYLPGRSQGTTCKFLSNCSRVGVRPRPCKSIRPLRDALRAVCAIKHRGDRAR